MAKGIIYNKIDIVVNIAVCTHITDFHISFLKSANMNHTESHVNSYNIN